MIPIFTRLLVTKIVASSLSGKSSSFAIVLFIFELEFRILLISEGDREKKAASEPEINAEVISRITITNNAMPRFKVNGFTVKSSAEIKTS